MIPVSVLCTTGHKISPQRAVTARFCKESAMQSTPRFAFVMRRSGVRIPQPAPPKQELSQKSRIACVSFVPCFHTGTEQVYAAPLPGMVAAPPGPKQLLSLARGVLAAALAEVAVRGLA